MPSSPKDDLTPYRRSICLPVNLIFFAIATDQALKMLARTILTDTGEYRFLGGLVRFTLVENHEGFLGIVRGLPSHLQFLFLYVCVALLLTCCLVYLFFVRRQTPHYDAPLALLTGGGLSNLGDRILHNGGVTDFMIVAIGKLHTGIFNLADVYILWGSFILGFLFFSRLNEKTS